MKSNKLKAFLKSDSANALVLGLGFLAYEASVIFTVCQHRLDNMALTFTGVGACVASACLMSKGFFGLIGKNKKTEKDNKLSDNKEQEEQEIEALK